MWRRGVGLRGAWRWGGVGAAESGGSACWKRRGVWGRRRRGRGFRLTLLTVEEKAPGAACERERCWASFYAGP